MEKQQIEEILIMLKAQKVSKFSLYQGFTVEFAHHAFVDEIKLIDEASGKDQIEQEIEDEDELMYYSSMG